MVSFKLLAISAIATAVVADTSCTVCDSKPPPCMTDAEAQQVATNFGLLISNYTNTLANNALASNYTDYSESVNSLINSCPTGNDAGTIPLLAPVFTNRTAFENGQGAQATNNYQQLNFWHTCDTATFRWLTTNEGGDPKNAQPSVGITTVLVEYQADNSDYPWIIDEAYTEFDAAAWLANLVAAGLCPASACNSTSTSKRSLHHAQLS